MIKISTIDSQYKEVQKTAPLLDALKKTNNLTVTENGGVAYKSTNSAVLDLFAMGSAMRRRSDEDCIEMFNKAFNEDPNLALKCLFYLRDIRQGQGERRFFRVVFSDFIKRYWKKYDGDRTNPLASLIVQIPEFGRWDDLYYLDGGPAEQYMYSYLYTQIESDLHSQHPSLCAKWLKGENARSKESKRLADRTRRFFLLDHRNYRHLLSILRERIRLTERLISQQRWDEINFESVPSKAAIRYSNLFKNNEMTRERYMEYLANCNSKMNTKALYPYDIVEAALSGKHELANKAWEQFCQDTKYNLNAIAMIDTSGSMRGRPINIAISLGMYLARTLNGPFANHYISFASRPQLIEIEGKDFYDQVRKIYMTNLVDNTNISAAFDLLLDTAVQYKLPDSAMPKNILIISDMEFDEAESDGSWPWPYSPYPSTKTKFSESVMDGIIKRWKEHGYTAPHLIYWNVNSHQNNVPQTQGEKISYISGASPVIMDSIMTGKTGYDLMLEKLNSERYKEIHL